MNQSNCAVLETESQSESAGKSPGFSFLSRVAQISAAQLIRRSTRFVFLFLAARKLGPETFGVYALLLALVETLALLSGEGFTDYLAREVSKSHESARGLYLRITQLRLVYVLILFAPALVLLHVLRYSGHVLSDAFWFFLILIPRAPLGSSQGVLRATHRVGLFLGLEVVQGTVLLSTSILLLRREASLRSIISAELAASFVTALVSILMVRELWREKLKSDVPWRQVLRETSAFNIYPLIVNIYDRIDVVLLSVLAGNVAVGLYALPYRAFAGLQIVPYGLMTALLPSIAGSASAQDDKQLCSRVTSLLYLLALFPVLAATQLAGPLVPLIFGKSYSESVPILRILIWATIPMFMNYGLNTFLLARSREKIFLWTSSVGTVINVTANLLLMPRYSFYAAAAVTILTEGILLLQHMLVIRRVFGFFPLPDKFWGASLIFLALLGGGVVGSRYVPSVLLAAASVFLFAAYLYISGSLKSIFNLTRSATVTG